MEMESLLRPSQATRSFPHPVRGSSLTRELKRELGPVRAILTVSMHVLDESHPVVAFELLTVDEDGQNRREENHVNGHEHQCWDKQAGHLPERSAINVVPSPSARTLLLVGCYPRNKRDGGEQMVGRRGGVRCPPAADECILQGLRPCLACELPEYGIFRGR
jgi:hypothetical protein